MNLDKNRNTIKAKSNSAFTGLFWVMFVIFIRCIDNLRFCKPSVFVYDIVINIVFSYLLCHVITQNPLLPSLFVLILHLKWFMHITLLVKNSKKKRKGQYFSFSTSHFYKDICFTLCEYELLGDVFFFAVMWVTGCKKNKIINSTKITNFAFFFFFFFAR